MHVITDRNSDVILGVGTNLSYDEFDNPVLTEQNVGFYKLHVAVYDVSEVPENIEPDKYCYSEISGFSENPNYVELNPYGISEELLTQIKNDTIAEVQKEAKNG